MLQLGEHDADPSNTPFTRLQFQSQLAILGLAEDDVHSVPMVLQSIADSCQMDYYDLIRLSKRTKTLQAFM